MTITRQPELAAHPPHQRFGGLSSGAGLGPASSPRSAASSAGIDALLTLLSLRDGYAGRDAQAVCELALEVGARLGLDTAPDGDLALAARLHDIGKVGVPDAVLHKPGRLDDDEQLVMRRHAVWGAAALSAIPHMHRVADVVRSHHERWDGKGYPSGLAGEAIPLASRIIGACEAYRAMVSERPYRHAMSAARAMEVVRGEAGAAFDPNVVKVLLAVVAGEAATDEDEAAMTVAAGGADPDGRYDYRERLPGAVAKLDGLPALSQSRDRVLELLRTDSASASEVVATLESDPALVIAVLRLANGRAGDDAERIGTIPDAVHALTPAGVEMLVSRITAVDFFQPMPGWDIPTDSFRVHALATQRAVARLAQHVEVESLDALLVAPCCTTSASSRSRRPIRATPTCTSTRR